jgi:hypothetical protein
MNLKAALGQGASGPAAGGSFAVKKRWDDGKPNLRNLTIVDSNMSNYRSYI